MIEQSNNILISGISLGFIILHYTFQSKHFKLLMNIYLERIVFIYRKDDLIQSTGNSPQETFGLTESNQFAKVQMLLLVCHFNNIDVMIYNIIGFYQIEIVEKITIFPFFLI